jgi:TolA-binding protein
LAGAGFWTNLRAGLAPGENDQISRFAAARFPNLPITEAVKRYGVVNGHIVYADPQGNYARETPSVSGATGPLDAFTRAGDFAAKEAGPTIPGAAGAAAGALVGPTGASIPAAAGTAAAVDVGRQALDKWLAGEPLHIDYLNSAGQGALAGVGQAAGVGAIKALNSNPLAVSAYDRTAAMDPATQAAAAALESEAARRGVNLSAGQSTGLRSVQATERQLSRYPETADQIYDFQKTQRQEQIPAAMRDEIAKISPAPPGEAAIGQFREGADKVVSDALNARAAQAKEAYTRALDGAPDADGNIVPKGPFWNEAVGSLMERPSMVRAIGRAQELAAEKGYSIKVPTYENGKLVKSEIAPDWRSWDYIKQGLDGEIEANTNDLGRLNTYGKAVADTKRELLSVLDKANPDYLAARLQYGSASDTVKTMLDGGLGILNTLKDAQPMDRVAIVRRMFDAGNLTPEEVGRMRVNFGVAGKQGEWNAGFANWLSDKLDTALTQAGDAGNVSAKLYKGIWQDPRQANIVRAALGPDGRAEGIEKLMEVVQASAKGLPEGSPTATDSAAMSSDAGKMISKGARVAATVVSPGSWLHLPELAMEGLAALRAPEKRIALAQTLLSGDAAGKLKQLAMLSPTSEKAVTLAGQILEMGGVGLSSLRTPRDFAPPAAP